MDKKLYLTLILIRTIYSGMHILTKAAFDGGMNTFVFSFYRQASATIFLVPIAIISERKRAPPLSVKLLFKMFLLAFGVTFTLDLYNVSLDYTSATLAAATVNTIPVTTFILAVLLGMEAVKIKSLTGIAKILGVALCLAGVVVSAFYQGPPLKSLNHHRLLGHKTSAVANKAPSSSKSWVKGCFIMVLANAIWSLWLVLQGRVLKQYPSKLLFTTFQSVFSSIQTFFTALMFERDFSRWKLGLDMGLLSVAYCGIIVTGVSFYLQAWCIERAGPVVLAMATPLSLVITVSCLSFIFGETISSGSIIGGVLMVGGLYSVLWGKSKERAHGMELPVTKEDGKEALQPLDVDEAAKTSNPDSSDSNCRIDQKIRIDV